MGQSILGQQDEQLAEFQGEYQQIQARVKESQQLIEQTQLEVNRLRDRNVSINAQLSRVEGNFDTVPRSDIKSAYENAMDAKSRLLTMQGQLEKAKATQEELQYFEELLRRLLGLMQGVSLEQLASSADHEGVEEEAKGLSTQAIVSLVGAQESERQRLAQQMHDGPAQSLTNFILQAEICQRLFDRNPDRAGEELNNLKATASVTFQKVRNFIFDLRPMMLDDLGLVPTIRRYIEAYQDKTDIETQLNILGEERRLPVHIEVMMFRAIQNIMGNARDTLGAKRMSIVLDVGPEWLKATMEHDGRGINSEAHAEDEQAEAFGLRALQERIELVGGSFDVKSSEDNISHYVLLLPVVE